MRMRTVAVLVVIVVILAGVTAWALMPRSAAVQGPGFDAVLARVTPEALQAIEVIQPDGKAITIAFEATSRQWIVQDTDRSRWPVVASRPRALAGLLAEVGKGSCEKTSEPSGTRTVKLAFDKADASATHEIRVDATALAGRTRVYTKDQNGQWWSAAADAQFAALFSPESLRAWADTHALIDLGQTASEIRLECADGRIKLERQGARWTITEPKLGNADAQAVTVLLQQLGEFTRVPGVAQSTKHTQLVFSASVTCALPGQSDAAQIVQTLRVSHDGLTPDVVEGDAMAMGQFAQSATLWGPEGVRIDRAKFDAISADPAKYIARIATEVPRADIGIIRVTRNSAAMDASKQLAPVTAADAASARSVTLSTNGATWRVTPMTSTGTGEPASRGVTATPEQEKWIAQVRDLLTSTRATSVSMGGSVGRANQAMVELVLTLASPGGAPLDVVAVGVSSEKGAPRVVIRRGNVYLMYDTGAGLVEWLERQLPPEG